MWQQHMCYHPDLGLYIGLQPLFLDGKRSLVHQNNQLKTNVQVLHLALKQESQKLLQK